MIVAEFKMFVSTISTQCNFFVKEKSSKSVQVKPATCSKSIACCMKTKTANVFTQTCQIAKSTLGASDIEQQSAGTQTPDDDISDVFYKPLYLLKSVSTFGCLRYQVRRKRNCFGTIKFTSQWCNMCSIVCMVMRV